MSFQSFSSPRRLLKKGAILAISPRRASIPFRCNSSEVLRGPQIRTASSLRGWRLPVFCRGLPETSDNAT